MKKRPADTNSYVLAWASSLLEASHSHTGSSEHSAQFHRLYSKKLSVFDSYKNKIISFYHTHKRMPGYQEIMDLVGFKSKNAVYKLINKLV